MHRFIRKLFGKTFTIRTASKPTARARLGVETMEDRLVPSGTGGWFDPTTVSYTAAQALFQVTGDVSGVTATAGGRAQVTFTDPAQLTAATVNGLNAVAGSTTAFAYNSSTGVLTADTNVTKNMTVTDLGGDVVTVGSLTLPGSLKITGGAIAVQPGATVGAQGNIQLTGLGTAPTPIGVSIPSGAKVQAGGGVSITGTGSNGSTSDNVGVLINTGSITAGDGGVRISGNGRGTGSYEDGIDLWNGATVSATGSGSVSLTGSGSSTGHDSDIGIALNYLSKVSTANGPLVLVGVGGGYGQWNYGVAVSTGALVQSTGAGAVSVTGDGGYGTNWDEGVLVASTGAVTASVGALTIKGNGHGSGAANNGIDINGHGAVRATYANSTLTGRGSGSGNGNSGVAIYSGGTVTGSYSMTIDIHGYGSSAGTYNNEGVYVNGTGTQIHSYGFLTLTGTGAGSGSSNYAVTISGGASVVGEQNDSIHGSCYATGSDANFGVNITDAGTYVGSSSANLNIFGAGGGFGNWDYGIGIQSGATVIGQLVTLTGYGSSDATGTMSDGVFLSGATVTSYGSGVLIAGTAGASSTTADGVSVNGSTVRAATGYVHLLGNGGASGYGVDVATGSSVAAPYGAAVLIGYIPGWLGVTPAVYTGGAVTGRSLTPVALTDPTVFNAVVSGYLSNSGLTYTGMRGVLGAVLDDGTVSGTESRDLQTLINAGGALNMPAYVAALANKVAHPSASFLSAMNLTTAPQYAQMLSAFNVDYMGTGRPADKFSRPDGSPSGFSTVDGGAYTLASGGLWGATGGPLYSDVQQQNLGDCTYMASMLEVAARNPQQIRDMFIDNFNGTYTVRFFHNGTPDYVTVDKYLPSGGGAFAAISSSGALWVALAEKAFVLENAEGWLGTVMPGTFTYAALDNGNSGTAQTALTALTGTNSGTTAINGQSVLSAWQSGKMVLLATPDFGNSVKSINGTNVVDSHMYAVTGYDGVTFTLSNPWGTGGGSYTTPNGTSVSCGGTIKGSWADLASIFSYSTTTLGSERQYDPTIVMKTIAPTAAPIAALAPAGHETKGATSPAARAIPSAASATPPTVEEVAELPVLSAVVATQPTAWVAPAEGHTAVTLKAGAVPPSAGNLADQDAEVDAFLFGGIDLEPTSSVRRVLVR